MSIPSKIIEAVVQTPGGIVTYAGDAKIDGVPGTGAPIVLNFLDAAGAKTGKLLPTGQTIDVIDGIEVSCVDLSSPLVFVRATDLGKTGYETKRELDSDLESHCAHRSVAATCRAADGYGRRCRQSVAEVCAGGATGRTRQHCGALLRSLELPLGIRRHRCAVPGRCGEHSGYGAPCGCARQRENSVGGPGIVVIEHPAGMLETRMTTHRVDGSDIPVFDRAGIVRTARPLLEGVVHISDDIWQRSAA